MGGGTGPVLGKAWKVEPPATATLPRRKRSFCMAPAVMKLNVANLYDYVRRGQPG